MSIQSEIKRIKDNIIKAFQECQNKGATIPGVQNSNNLSDCIKTILTPSGNISITENGDFDVTQYATANVNVEGANKLCIPLGTEWDFYLSGSSLIKSKEPFDFDTGDATILKSWEFANEFYMNSGLKNVILKNIKLLDTTSIENCFKDSSVEKVIAPKLTKIVNYSDIDYPYLFDQCTKLNSVEFPVLKEIEGRGLGNCFNLCTQLKSINFPALTTVTDLSLKSCFSECTQLSNALFPNLKSINFNSFNNTFAQTGLTTISFPKLDTIANGDYLFRECFGRCSKLKEVYFNSLTATTFQNFTTNNIDTAFFWMLGGVKNCTVHFKPELQDIFKNSPQFKNGFGDSSTIILFDL